MADSDEDREFGRTFKAWRELREITQADAAKAAGVRQPFLSKVENGEAIPSLQRCRLLAKAIGLRIRIMFEP